MEWLPTASAEVTRVATPLFSVAVPNVPAASVNVTVPVGKLGPVPTVATDGHLLAKDRWTYR